ncbi:MAG TPA: prolyl oligopeptidase family serine peptidase [Burkholderiaceae bacterium]
MGLRWLAMLAATASLCATASAFEAAAAFNYQQPSPAVREVLDAPALPRLLISPDHQTLALLELKRFSSVEELARPVLRLAGLRFDPTSDTQQGITQILRLRLRSLLNPDAPERTVDLPNGGVFHDFSWAPDGRHFLIERRMEQTSELWVGDSNSGRVSSLTFIHPNDVLMQTPAWLNPRELVLVTIPDHRGAAPQAPRKPAGPAVQENRGVPSPERTFQDLLGDAYDEALFEFHARSVLTRVDIQSGISRDLSGPPALFNRVVPVGEKFLLTERLNRPFSYALPWDSFPRIVELRTIDGRVVRELARMPLKSGVSIDGVLPGPRAFFVSPFADGAIYWVEALDGGNQSAKVPFRDRIMRLDAPYTGEPQEVQRMPHRFTRLDFLDDGQNALLTENDRSRNWLRTYLLPLKGSQSRLLFEYSARERYRHPGNPLTRQLPNGRLVTLVDHGDLLMTGPGASPKGERPFLDRFSLKDSSVTRVFQSSDTVYEQVLFPLDGGRLLTERETIAEPPNLYLRDGTGLSALTRLKDPTPQLRKLHRELITFKRADGVDMSFWLYLPPDYKEGERRPALVWSYPLEFPDRASASQMTGSDNHFTQPTGLSPLLLALDGYAVLMDATMPIVGDPRNVNDSFVEQVVMNARAIVEKATELPSIDEQRLAVGGHSYGAFMTANLVAHTDLFRCGIARSGAYNRLLTPFGFQSERRNLWEARDVYLKLSPLLYVDHIKEPLLIIHGENDNNSGTFPLQSERLYQALAGTGGTARYVLLPLESHNYTARESVGHVQWEMSRWLRSCLGDPRAPAPASAAERP